MYASAKQAYVPFVSSTAVNTPPIPFLLLTIVTQGVALAFAFLLAFFIYEAALGSPVGLLEWAGVVGGGALALASSWVLLRYLDTTWPGAMSEA